MHIIEDRKEDEVAIMLIQFNFKNFRSFREEVTLDLSATKMTEFSERVVTIGSEKILPVAAIYGANASGKSNIYSAFLRSISLFLEIRTRRHIIMDSALIRKV